MSAKSGKSKPDKDEKKFVCRNRRALHDFDILQQLDCGIVLMGSEVKSIRAGKITIDESFARVEKGEVWLLNADIAEYPQASYLNHERKRPRKLLMKRREILKFAEAAGQKGLTLIPLSVQFDRGFVKVTLAVGKGRQLHDKREKLKKDSASREMREAVRKRR
ncbi:MAG TPA: SsrA-binding protein SmpB [Caulifigura sp.]|jgi:SsrA-binding protein|nr:SsrA-binding protein SmpB [Caulifigura sp.]